MTAMINYRDNPRYQRLIRKFAALRPEQRAVVDTAMAVDEKFGGEAMSRHLGSIMAAADRKNKEAQLGLGERRLAASQKQFDVSMGLKREEWGFEKRQERLGKYLGTASIPIKGYMGYRAMKSDLAEAEEQRKWRERIMKQMEG